MQRKDENRDEERVDLGSIVVETKGDVGQKLDIMTPSRFGAGISDD